jgi:hypothetical protein
LSKKFPDPKFKKIFSKIFHLKKPTPFQYTKIFIIKHTTIMDIQKCIHFKTGVLLPISGGNGQSQDQAVVIDSKAKYRLIQVENEFISAMVDDGYWKKVEQSLIFDEEIKYEKITIHNFFDD